MWYLSPQIGPWPVLVALAPWLARLVLGGRLGWSTPFDVPLVLFVVSAGLGVWSAYDREAAWSKFWLIVGGFFIFYALANGLAQANDSRKLDGGGQAADAGRAVGEGYAWLMAIFGAGVAVYFAATHDWDLIPGKFAALEALGRAIQAPLPALPGHRLHPNVAGGLMAMMLPFTILVSGQSGRRLVNRRSAEREGVGRLGGLFLAGLALLLVTVLGLLLSNSRGAWLALAAAGGLAMWGVLARKLSKRRPQRRAWIFFGGLTLALAAVWVLFWVWPSALTTVLNSLPDLGSGLKRIDLYRNSLILVMDYPVIGAGLAGFMTLYSAYSFLIHVGFSVHSHNLFLNVAIEQGLPALLVLAWMWLLVGEAVWRDMADRAKFKRRPSSDLDGLDPSDADSSQPGTRPAPKGHSARRRPGPPALDAAALSLVVILLHGLVDDPLYGSRAVLLLFLPLAFAVPALTANRGPSLREQWRVWLGWLALVLLVVVIWWRPLLSIFEANLAAVRQSQSELAIYAWPEWPIQDAVRRAVEMGPVVAGYERALAANSGNASANRRLGQIELSLGAYETAVGHLEAAYLVTPWDNATRQLLGEAYLVNGRMVEGQTLWRGVNNDQGQLGLRAFWYEYIGDEARLEAVRSAAGQ